ncbi:HEAT repeat domain-containing protein [Kribbella deserti]|uniref:HEAT repeat domain-containing protein n=1 Tax=Kribbella deserti TaxID=1926257 RepID=A0ABV6QL77_9ACTN
MTHPRQMIGAACAEYGEDAVVDWCIALLTGEVSAEEAYSPDLLPKLQWISGPLAGGWSKLDPVNFYWVRVWAARAFLYVWRDDVVPALLIAANDPAWRVREHVARITAQRQLGQLADALVPLLEHDLPRVRAAGARALGAAGESEHAEPLKSLRNDPDPTVRTTATRALTTLATRLGRPL